MSLLGNHGSDFPVTSQFAESHKIALWAGTMSLLSSNIHDWIIDSGATDHICPDISMFHHHEDVTDTNNFITIPNGTRIKVLHKGSVRINEDIILHNVLHVPEFCFSLISVTKLCANWNCQVFFTNKECFIQSLVQNRPPILLGSSINGFTKYLVHPLQLNQFISRL